ncbi:MAG: L-threonylcarbamoyladenylate synthase [Butyricicoccus sp.]|nr:L-threonylcarbamoyladenylate synthase [Butyricicoccus sp.]
MKTEVIKDNADVAAEIIKGGGVAAVPTETVYGLAANGLDASAVKKLYEIKGRPEVKPISLLVSGPEEIEQLCRDVPPQAKALGEKFWPGPLTIVLPSRPEVPEIVRAGGDTVGLRCPDHPLTLELLRKADVPLAAPSANPSGESSPLSARQVLDYFDGKIDAVVDGGECSVGRESTVLDMSAAPYRVLRQGALPEREIAAALAENMTLVGITGGSGCGKTTALGVLRGMGALIIDCDEVYHELCRDSAEMKGEICARFGEVWGENGLDRKKLGAVVFKDPDALTGLNAITHRYVYARVEELLHAHAMSGGTLAAIDAIALIEGDFAKRTAFNVAVTATEENRVRRLVAREGISEEYARARIAAQRECGYFVKNCDYALENDGDIDAFKNKCKKFFTEVLRNA